MALPVRHIEAPRRRATSPTAPARTGGASRAEQPHRSRSVGRATPTAATRPGLRVVPRRRTAFTTAVLLVAVVVGLMLAAVVLHTHLTERQLEIDQLEQDVTDARGRFDVLRRQ